MSMEMVEVTKEEPKIGVYICHCGGNISSANEMSFSTTLPKYNKVQNTFETFTARISKIDPLSEETQARIREKLQLNQFQPFNTKQLLFNLKFQKIT